MSNPTSDFVSVNGIRLHYLDWGGSDPALIFLTGMGCTAYIFSDFAPRFTDRFRVLALTRRGQGDSYYPDTGYDADTLVEDIRQFMDQLHIQTAVLAGHSLAGVELTHFAATYPDRVEKLIYLDALDDRRGFAALHDLNPLKDVEPEKSDSAPRSLEEYISDSKRDMPYFAEIWSEVWEAEFTHNVKVNEEGIYVGKMPAAVAEMMTEHLIKGYAPKPVTARIPILSFVALGSSTLGNGYTAAQRAAWDQFERQVRQPFARSLAAEFQSRFPQARIVVLPDGHHYCFLVQAEQVYAEMRKFMLE